jgi:hypothetical protein
MPRTNRVARAIAHENPLVGCIMLLQEKIKFLGRSLVGCKCPEHEAKIVSLQDQDFILRDELSTFRAELTFLEKKYKEVSEHNTRLRAYIRTSGSKYRERISSLLAANSSRLRVQTCQHKAYQAEIISLRSHVSKLQDILKEHEISLPLPSPPIPWVLNTDVQSPSWDANPEWAKLHPNVILPDNPRG